MSAPRRVSRLAGPCGAGEIRQVGLALVARRAIVQRRDAPCSSRIAGLALGRPAAERVATVRYCALILGRS